MTKCVVHVLPRVAKVGCAVTGWRAGSPCGPDFTSTCQPATRTGNAPLISPVSVGTLFVSQQTALLCCTLPVDREETYAASLAGLPARVRRRRQSLHPGQPKDSPLAYEASQIKVKKAVRKTDVTLDKWCFSPGLTFGMSPMKRCRGGKTLTHQSWIAIDLKQ